MKCVICRHGETRPGHITVTLQRNGSTLVVRSVPGDVCENCGEQYVDAPVAAKLLEEADRAVAAGVEVEVRSYVAA